MTTTLLFLAVCMVETGMHPGTVNAGEGAYGPAQVTAACLHDVNRHAGTSLRLTDLTNGVSASFFVFRQYADLNGATTPAAIVRTWRGGKRGGHRARYDGYVRRVLAVFEQFRRERQG